MTDYPIAPFYYIHKDCGKPAFYLKKLPAPLSMMNASDALHVDGRPMKFGEPIMCDSCGERIEYPKTEDVQPVEIFD